VIQPQTRLKVADNTGAKELMCIRVMSGSAKQYAGVGDVIKASVKQAAPNGQVKKGRSGQRRGCACGKGICARRWLAYPL